MARSQYGLPMIVSGDSARGLERVRFERADDGSYNERWLQRMISRHPTILPIDQMEPALTPAISVCMELPLNSGYVDNLFVTPRGDLIVGETKLFRNVEARREVVAQIIDYAKDLSALSYEGLDNAVRKAESPTGNGGHPARGLYGAVTESPDNETLTEERFVDNVTRNLARGRFLLLIIGDGIQLGTENIAAFLQQHAGMHFTFGLIELATFRMPNDTSTYLVQPRILARTINIDRGIVTIEDGRIVAKPPTIVAAGTSGEGKRVTITEEHFYERLGVQFPSIITHLKAFVAEVEPLGVTTDFGKESMIFRWQVDDRRTWNIGTIQADGKIWTEMVNGQADAVGLIALSHHYLAAIAALIPGAYVKQNPNPKSWYVAKKNTYIKVDDLLIHADGWRAAIADFTATVRKALSVQPE